MLFSGDEGNWGRGLYELDDSSLVMAESELEEGDTPFEVRQLVTSQGEDFAVDGDLLGGYGINRGFAVLYADGAKIMRQNFRETGDVARTNGKPQNVTKKIADLEDELGIDFDGDSLIGAVLPEIDQVLFNGLQGDWRQGVYALNDGSLIFAERDLAEGDEVVDGFSVLASSTGQDYFPEGEVVGAYGSSRKASLAYVMGESFFTQSFRLNGDTALASGPPITVTDNIFAMEDQHGIDFTRDNIFGEVLV